MRIYFEQMFWYGKTNEVRFGQFYYSLVKFVLTTTFPDQNQSINVTQAEMFTEVMFFFTLCFVLFTNFLSVFDFPKNDSRRPKEMHRYVG